jgi:hypothetical protein
MDDIVFVGGNLEKVNHRLDDWRSAPEGEGLKIIRNKTEYIYCILHSMILEKDTKKLRI